VTTLPDHGRVLVCRDLGVPQFLRVRRRPCESRPCDFASWIFRDREHGRCRRHYHRRTIGPHHIARGPQQTAARDPRRAGRHGPPHASGQRHAAPAQLRPGAPAPATAQAARPESRCTAACWARSQSERFQTRSGRHRCHGTSSCPDPHPYPACGLQAIDCCPYQRVAPRFGNLFRECVVPFGTRITTNPFGRPQSTQVAVWRAPSTIDVTIGRLFRGNWPSLSGCCAQSALTGDRLADVYPGQQLSNTDDDNRSSLSGYRV